MKFRLSAVASMSDSERLHSLLQVTAPREWAVVTAVFVLVAGVAAWGVLGTVERAVFADCVVVRPGARNTVVSGVAGTVTDVLVSPGDAVAAGDVLARVRQPAVERDLRIAEARLDRLELEFAAIGGVTVPPSLVAARDGVADLRAALDAGGIVTTPWAGEVEFASLTPGGAVAAGAEVAQVRTGPDAPLEVLAFVPASAAVEEGQAASVRPSNGGSAAFDARVGRPGDVVPAAPGWLANLGAGPTAESGRLLRLAVDAEAAGLAPGGCQARVVTARHAPVLLLAPAGID